MGSVTLVYLRRNKENFAFGLYLECFNALKFWSQEEYINSVFSELFSE